MIKELDLLEVKNIRDKHMDRIDVLEKVKHLLLLPNIEFATVGQVAEYYEVGTEAVKTIVTRHKDEFKDDGLKTHSQQKVIDFLKVQDETLERVVGKAVATLDNNVKVIIPNRGLILFTKRAILRVGMLLRDSKVAKEVRTQL